MQSRNPTTGALLEAVPFDSPPSVEAKLAAAADRVPRWAARTFAERAACLLRLGDALKARRDELAIAMVEEMGKPIREARAEVDKSVGCCAYFAEHAEAFLRPAEIASDASLSYVAYEPLGAVLAIMPWNFPVWQVIRFAAPTLMAGNVAMLKHAPSVPRCARLITQSFRDAGYPEGAFQNLLVAEESVESLIADDRVAAVTLTGSVRAGRAVAAMAGRAIKPCVLELGGSDPFVVLADADLDSAIEGAVFSRFLNNGQSCIAAKRLIVEAPVYERFHDAIVARASALVVGDPSDESTDIGPMAREDLRAALHAQVRQSTAAGALLQCGGEIPNGPGFYYPPTVLADVTPEMCAFREELFGPVATLVRADDAEHALALAANTRFGLGASIWTERARGIELSKRLSAGCVAVNGIVKSDSRLPFGGIKESGFGRELSRAGILAFVNAKTVWIR